jgi:hypothetical protein
LVLFGLLIQDLVCSFGPIHAVWWAPVLMRQRHGTVSDTTLELGIVVRTMS